MKTAVPLMKSVAQWICATSLAAASLGAPAADLGVYRWDAPNGPSNVDGFSQWLGTAVPLAEAFEANDTWDNVDGAGWQLGPWSQWVKAQAGRNLILSVPMLPGGANGGGPDGIVGTVDDVSLAACGNGDYDDRWRNLANELAGYGLADALLRLGWEPDGGWYAWNAPEGSGKEASYASCFRRIVQVMRAAQPAAQWKFILNPTTAWWDKSYLSAIWPGDDYVDVVGLDLYDQSWATGTYPYPSVCDDACRLTHQQAAWAQHSWYLNAIRELAIAHGKPMAIPEWGVALRPDGHGGGDNPFFIQNMHDYIADPANAVLFHSYFDISAVDINARLTDAVTGDNPSGPTSFPNSAALFQQLFGASAADSSGATPAPAPTPTDTLAPQVALIWPASGSILFRRTSYTLEATASDDTGVVGVDFYVDDSLVCRVASSPYRCAWRTSNGKRRSYTIKAMARDAAGNQASSTVIYTAQ
jgi:hypothetical protein